MIKKSPLVRLKKHKTNVGFSDLVHVLIQNGYFEQSVKGSHHIFGKHGHLPIMIVKPHGGKKSCHPMDVNKVIKMLEALNED